jgi:hypothetical protein
MGGIFIYYKNHDLNLIKKARTYAHTLNILAQLFLLIL